MKPFITFLLFITATVSSIFAECVKVDFLSSYLEITGVERLDTCLRMSVKLKHLPNFWVQIDKEASLRDHNDATRNFKLIGSENIELGTHIFMDATGQRDGVLIFEPVPTSVKVVDLLEGESGNFNEMAAGICLDETAEEIIPDIISSSVFFKGESIGRWTGPDPSRYPDIPGYTEGGKAHVCGKINDYSATHGPKTMTLRTSNALYDRQDVNLGDINPDGTFAFDIKVDYPQYNYLRIGNHGRNIFVSPGDTVEIETTTLTDFLQPENGYLRYFGFKNRNNDATTVNILTDTVAERYGLNDLYDNYYARESDSLRAVVMATNGKISAHLDRVVSDLPEFLGPLPVSTFVKDILAAYAIGKLAVIEEDNEMTFSLKHQPVMSIDSLGNMDYQPGETLDLTALFEPRKQHNELIYNNPIIICSDFILPNRWQYGQLFAASTAAADGSISPTLISKLKDFGITDMSDLSSIEMIQLIDNDNSRRCGVGNCFAAQLSRVASLNERLHTSSSPDRETLDKKRKLVTNLASLVRYPSLNGSLLNTYGALAEDVAKAESSSNDSSDFSILNINGDADVLKELIKPYSGNLIFIDFWGLGCGPCRSGMISQKHILEMFADEPFKVLYVADDTNVDGCRRWLEKEGIKGEHIFVSTDNWNRLASFFNFTGIPFGALIGKDGNILKTNVHLNENEIKRHLK